MKEIKSYLMELTIVALGVFIALFVGGIKEKNETRRYYDATIETINKEVEANYSSLKGVIEKQKSLLDTLRMYSDTSTVVGEIFTKSGGLQAVTLNNTGFYLYKRNQINRIDIGTMSTLNDWNHVHS